MSHLAIFYSLYNIIAIFAYITSSLQWRQGLNPRPLGCESFALTTKPWFVALFKNCGGEYEVNPTVRVYLLRSLLICSKVKKSIQIESKQSKPKGL